MYVAIRARGIPGDHNELESCDLQFKLEQIVPTVADTIIADGLDVAHPKTMSVELLVVTNHPMIIPDWELLGVVALPPDGRAVQLGKVPCFFWWCRTASDLERCRRLQRVS